MNDLENPYRSPLSSVDDGNDGKSGGLYRGVIAVGLSILGGIVGMLASYPLAADLCPKRKGFRAVILLAVLIVFAVPTIMLKKKLAAIKNIYLNGLICLMYALVLVGLVIFSLCWMY